MILHQVAQHAEDLERAVTFYSQLLGSLASQIQSTTS